MRNGGWGSGAGGRGSLVPGHSQEGSRKENKPPGAGAVSLAVLQQSATAIVAKGQIIPILPASPLYRSILGGEHSIKDVLNRELNIGSQAPAFTPPGGTGGPGYNINPTNSYGGAGAGGGNGGGGGGYPQQGGNFQANNYGGGSGGRRWGDNRGSRNRM